MIGHHNIGWSYKKTSAREIIFGIKNNFLKAFDGRFCADFMEKGLDQFEYEPFRIYVGGEGGSRFNGQPKKRFGSLERREFGADLSKGENDDRRIYQNLCYVFA